MLVFFSDLDARLQTEPLLNLDSSLAPANPVSALPQEGLQLFSSPCTPIVNTPDAKESRRVPAHAADRNEVRNKLRSE